jgi:NAD(P) transhydrogenase
MFCDAPFSAPAPVQAMVENMPAGGVTVDLAAPAGGNVATTQVKAVASLKRGCFVFTFRHTHNRSRTLLCAQPGVVSQHGSITCVGYTNMESRMGQTASSLFGGNVTNFLLSMEDKVKCTPS